VQRKRAEIIHYEAFTQDTMQAPTAPTHEISRRKFDH
jgi:hypothetical protein